MIDLNCDLGELEDAALEAALMEHTTSAIASSVRATAQGMAYNTGRALSGFAPVTIGALADRYGIGAALGFTSIFFVAGALLMLRLPETRGEELA